VIPGRVHDGEDCALDSNGCSAQFAHANPVLQVVGEAGSEHFRVHFGQAAQVELAHPSAFDPGVAELDHSVAGDINPRLRVGHRLTKSDHGLGFPRVQQAAAAMLISRAALRL
jgi:hypothetical protein